MAIQGHVTGVTEGNREFAQFGHFREGAAYIVHRLQQQ